MRKLVLYIATSLDGKIADENHQVDWLEQMPNPEMSDYGYHDFLNNVDTTIMGNSTYRWLQRQDFPFPYSDKENFVLTKNESLTKDENVFFVSKTEGFVEDLKSKEGKYIWLIGGGQLASHFLNQGLIDEIRLFVMPILLGDGINLFQNVNPRQQLMLLSSSTYNSGVVELRYRMA
jgi:dihydrofolate reductase